MEPRISLITLGVTDLERATRFYEECLGLPRLKTPPSVTFFELGRRRLALWARAAADAGLSPEGSGFPALPWPQRAFISRVDALLACHTYGAVVKPGHPTDWSVTQATSQTSTGFFGRSRSDFPRNSPIRRSSQPACFRFARGRAQQLLREGQS
jgi:catechol 2,3-dioxygenase-like lactoylglutathione lyase family enzyme